jgi:hypothetical protein
MSCSSLESLASFIESLPDPRSKQGVSHSYHGMVTIVLLGLIAGIPYMAWIRRWAEKHWHTLRAPLKFKEDKLKPPVETTFFRALAKTSVADFQKIFAEFLQHVLAQDHDTLVAAVDGKVAKQMKNADGDPILLLNILAHNIKVTLADYDVRGDKTNEPGCLKNNLESLFEQYPLLKLLTGDAIFAQRPLLEVLQEHGCDYLFQIKENQPDVLDAAQVCFADVNPDVPDAHMLEKKTAKWTSEKSGSILSVQTISESA